MLSRVSEVFWAWAVLSAHAPTKTGNQVWQAMAALEPVFEFRQLRWGILRVERMIGAMERQFQMFVIDQNFQIKENLNAVARMIE